MKTKPRLKPIRDAVAGDALALFVQYILQTIPPADGRKAAAALSDPDGSFEVRTTVYQTHWDTQLLVAGETLWRSNNRRQMST